jgi:hypothetical protein
VRLLDADRHPLAGWHVESRSARSLGDPVDRGDTDVQGRIAIVIDPAGRTDLLAHPPGASTMPKMRLPVGNLDRNEENEIVLDRDVQPAQLVATILSSDPAIEARLWNIETDEGMRLPVVENPAEPGAPTGRKVRADVIAPGTYVLEIGARCMQWKRMGPFRVAGGQLLDAGTWTLDPPARVEVRGIPPKCSVKFSARARAHGLWLVSEHDVTDDAPTLTLTPGEWTITIRTPDGTTPQRTFGPRVIRAESGRAITLDFEETNEPR